MTFNGKPNDKATLQPVLGNIRKISSIKFINVNVDGDKGKKEINTTIIVTPQQQDT